MKFIVEQSALVDGVNWVSRSLSTRPIKTELLGIVIDATGDQVYLSASDLETASKSHFQAEIKDAGKVLVPGKLLAEISRALPNKPITFALDGTRVLVTSGSAKFTLPTLSVDEYPNLPELPDATGTLASDVFATAVSQVAIAAGRDDSLPTLTGVHVEINEETVTLAATDRYRLAVREIQWDPTTPNVSTSALLRARTIADAAKSLTGTKTVSISFAPSSSNDRLAGFAGDGKTMTSRMLDGTFPPYRHLLPTDSVTTAVVEINLIVGENTGADMMQTVPLGSSVRITVVNPNASDEIHVHGYDISTGEMAQGQEAVIEFVPSNAGTFDIESHVSEEVVFVLTVE